MTDEVMKADERAPDYKAAMMYHSDRADAFMEERDKAQARIAELEAEVARKDDALRRLEYWLDTWPEILDAMPDDERASHLRMLGIARAALSPKEE
jgi:hypothetical protein